MKPLLILLALSSLCSADTLRFDQMIIFGDGISDNGNVYLALGGESPAPFPPQYTVGRFTNSSDVTPGTAHQGLWHEQLSAMTGLPVTLPFLAGGLTMQYRRCRNRRNDFGDGLSGFHLFVD